MHNGYLNSRGEKIPPIDIRDYPAIKKWLDQFWDKLVVRQDQGDTPYNLRSCAYLHEFEKEKIIYPNMTKYLPFFLDENGYFTNQKCFIMTGRFLSYLTAFFNSQIFKFAYREKFPVLLGGTRELSKIFFDKLRIPKIDSQTEEKFRIMTINIQHKISLNLDISEEDENINLFLYNIYDLDDAEQNIIKNYNI